MRAKSEGSIKPPVYSLSREESIGNAITVSITEILQPYTEGIQITKSQMQIMDEKTSWIYDIVGKAVSDMRKKVPPVVQQRPTIQQGPSRAVNRAAGLVLVTQTMPIEIKVIHEKNQPASRLSSPAVSSEVLPSTRPTSSERPDSVKTNDSAPHSASTSHRTIDSSGSGRPDSVETNYSAPHSAASHGSRGSERPDSVKTNNSAPHSASSPHRIQSSETSAGDPASIVSQVSYNYIHNYSYTATCTYNNNYYS